MSKNNIEIERKFLIESIPFDLSPYKYYTIKQAYISTNPTIRLREQNEKYIFTFKGNEGMKKTEFEYELNQTQFKNLWEKVETNKIIKKRYIIPIQNNLIAELDIYEEDLKGFMNIEVEFDTIEDADIFIPPKWFGKEVTGNNRFTNASLSILGIPVKNL